MLKDTSATVPYTREYQYILIKTFYQSEAGNISGLILMFWVDTGLPCVIEKRTPIIPIKHMSSSHSLHLLKKQLYDTKFTIKETHIDIKLTLDIIYNVCYYEKY